MERDDLASLAGIFYAAPLERGTLVRLDETATHHLRVRRLEAGERVYLADGAGRQAVGSIVHIGKKDAEVSIDDVMTSPRGAPVHLVVPVADRDRMMWCAEKCAELGAASWRPVLWHRSRSVSPRGEGDAFREKIVARMSSALIQSRAPWLPDVEREVALSDALSRLPTDGTRLSLEQGGQPIALEHPAAPVSIAIGPEGGMESSEREMLRNAGFRAVSLGANVLRFETAAVAALAIVRSKLEAARSSPGSPAPPEKTNG